MERIYGPSRVLMTEDDTFARLKRIPFKDMVAIIVEMNAGKTLPEEGDYLYAFRINGWTRREYRDEIFRRD